MTDPITPPRELVEQWLSEHYGAVSVAPGEAAIYVATKAARWGADQELKACCNWLPKLPPWSADDLRRHRRPKPPSLKERALKELRQLPIDSELGVCASALDTIRRAIEALPE